MSPVRCTIAAACVVMLLGGCSGSPNTGDSAPSRRSPASPLSPTLSPTTVDPAATAVHTQRRPTTFRVGQRAEVIYRATPTRTYRLGLAVVRVRKVSLRDLSMYVLDHRSAESRLYYVDLRATNRGHRNSGSTPLRLFGVDTLGVVLPPVRFRGPFPRCDTTRLPRRFRAGDAARACLVYLVPRHGHLSAVQVRYGKWAGPISWQVAGQVQSKPQGRQQGKASSAG